MFKKAIAALSAAAMCLGLWACSADESGIKAAMVTSGMAISDNHTNQSAWEGLERLEEEYRTDINNYRPQQNDTESFMVGVKTLVEAGYNTIILSLIHISAVFSDGSAWVSPQNAQWESLPAFVSLEEALSCLLYTSRLPASGYKGRRQDSRA